MANTKRTGKLVADCPNCKGFAADARCRPVTFRMQDGTTHAAPDMWLAGRSQRIGVGLDSFMQACAQWADHCAMEQAVARQQQRAA